MPNFVGQDAAYINFDCNMFDLLFISFMFMVFRTLFFYSIIFSKVS